VKSLLFDAVVGHGRVRPAPHGFSYSFPLFAFEFEQLGDLSRFWPLLGSRLSFFSVRRRDYLPHLGGSWEEKLRALGGAQTGGGVLLTMPRTLGFVFNPVNFYLFRGAGGGIARVAAEVHNTFGEGSVYVCDQPPPRNAASAGPFFSRRGSSFPRFSTPGASTG